MRYLSIWYTKRLAEAGAAASVGSRGDSHDNALAGRFTLLVVPIVVAVFVAHVLTYLS